MTPSQRQYDLDLAKSMRLQADHVQSRSAKVALTLRQGADRIEALTQAVPLDPVPPPPPEAMMTKPMQERADG